MAYPDLSETVNYLVDSANPTGYAQVIEERDGDGTLLKSYAIGDDVLSQSTHSSFPLSPSYFLCDGHGSTRQLVDESGDITAQYTYDSYGVMLGQTAGAQARQATDLLYSGERFDPALQQYYLRARYYEPTRGRFWTMDGFEGFSADPISLHKYLYANANPVMNADPSGRFSLTEMMYSAQTACTLARIAVPSALYSFGAAKITLGVSALMAAWPAIEAALSTWDFMDWMKAESRGAPLAERQYLMGMFFLGVVGPGGAYSQLDEFADIAKFKRQLGLGNKDVIAMLKVEGQPAIYGMNASMPRPNKTYYADLYEFFRTINASDGINGVHPSFLGHAEGDVLTQAFNGGIEARKATLYVDNVPCGFCQNSFKNMMNALGLDELTVIWPEGSKMY